jgi:hypothetical protein
MAFVSAFAVVCERIMVERDNVPSLIRMVDLFRIPSNAPRLGSGGLLPIPMSIYMMIRISPDDDAAHSASFTVIRPDGSQKPPLELFANQIAAPSIAPDGDRTFNTAALVGVEVTNFGKHRIVLNFDGQPVTETSFFILEMNEEETATNPNPA